MALLHLYFLMSSQGVLGETEPDVVLNDDCPRCREIKAHVLNDADLGSA